MIPPVAASERGGAQTGGVSRCTPLRRGGVVGSAWGHVHVPVQLGENSLIAEASGKARQSG